MLHDPVCGQRIQRGRAYARVQHDGYTYYLCCPRCQAYFEANPSLFAREDHGEKVRRPQSGPTGAKAQRRSLSYR